MFKEYTLGRKYTTRSDQGQGSIVQRIQRDFPEIEWEQVDSKHFLEFKLGLFSDLVEGNHTWTVRYKPGVVRWPYNSYNKESHNRLPFCFSEAIPAGQFVLIEEAAVGEVTIPKMAVGYIRDWPEKHKSIAGSGWESKEHMIDGLSDIYEPIYGNRLGPDDILVAYAFKDVSLYPKIADKWELAKETGLSARKWQRELLLSLPCPRNGTDN